MKGFKTIGFNAIMLLGALTGAAWSPELVNEWLNAFAILWGAGNMILRAVTNTPIFRKE